MSPSPLAMKLAIMMIYQKNKNRTRNVGSALDRSHGCLEGPHFTGNFDSANTNSNNPPSSGIIANTLNLSRAFSTNFDESSASIPSDSNSEIHENNCHVPQQESSLANHSGGNVMGTNRTRNPPLSSITNNSSNSDNSVTHNNNALNEKISKIDKDRDLFINQDPLQSSSFSSNLDDNNEDENETHNYV